MLEYEALPPRLAAALFYGLRDDARVKLRLAGTDAGTDTLLRAVIADRLGLLVWAKTQDAQHGRNRPASFMDALRGGAGERSGKDMQTFADGAAFEAARAKIVKEAESWQRCASS